MLDGLRRIHGRWSWLALIPLAFIGLGTRGNMQDSKAIQTLFNKV